MPHRLVTRAVPFAVSLFIAAAAYADSPKLHDIVVHGETVTIADVDGWAVAYGDVLLGPIDDVLSGDTRAIFNRRLWPDGVVGYRIDPAMPAGNLSNIDSAMQHIEDTTSIVFEERTAGDYVFFRPTSSACQSFVGRQGGAQNLFLAPACNRGNTVHEILHALGFHHEHQRPDRDEYITVDLAQACFGSGSNFAILSTFQTDQMGPYDYGSIMHYFWNTFSCTGQPTIIGPPGVPLGSFFNMSAHDIDAVEWLYFRPDYSSDDDGDDVENVDDRCLEINDSIQRDTDDDGFGNLCDPDLNQDGVVNVIDLGVLRSRFFSADPDADFNGDGVVNVQDLGIMRTYFFLEPGPSGRTPGTTYFSESPVATSNGDGTYSVAAQWSAPNGLADEYIVETDHSGIFEEACRTSELNCTVDGIPASATQITLRVRAVAPYGNEGANGPAVVVDAP